jgi:hypothetical protein
MGPIALDDVMRWGENVKNVGKERKKERFRMGGRNSATTTS